MGTNIPYDSSYQDHLECDATGEREVDEIGGEEKFRILERNRRALVSSQYLTFPTCLTVLSHTELYRLLLLCAAWLVLCPASSDRLSAFSQVRQNQHHGTAHLCWTAGGLSA